ncbi:transcriptional regulator [Apibacter muscae]|uniref:Transcriptional regulator n=1 Tax=Apibacter muscae TaxID=2509004 RepID=A0A563DHY2_9FLAO|nr:transcriptional repressor [Apibacter muscae]TWP29868.1 transcriptional regulator [Apibacter muscae]TWP31016.1 transcriptional regulator [Apibacter muscae]
MDKAKIEDKLNYKNVKPTNMRILVYNFLKNKKVALSLTEIENYFEYADRITIYRTLKTFEEKGLVHSIQENNTSKYILCKEDCDEQLHNDWHLHLSCKICGETTCREEVVIPEILNVKFRIEEIHFSAKGICERCLQELQ